MFNSLTLGANVLRGVLEQALLEAKRMGLKAANVRIGVLRLYCPLDPADPNIVFPIDYEGQQKLHKLSQGLYNRDVFIAAGSSLGIQPTKIIDGKERLGNTPIYYFPDATVFNGAATATAVSEAQALEALYNAQLSTKSDEAIRLNDFPTDIYRTVGTTQGGSNTVPEVNGEQYKDLGRPMKFVGGDDSEVTIRLASTVSDLQNIAGTADHNNWAVMSFIGAVIRNGAKKSTIGMKGGR